MTARIGLPQGPGAPNLGPSEPTKGASVMIESMPGESDSFRRIGKVIEYIDRHHANQPDLDKLARVAGLSPFHFSREFRRWAGLSPTRYLRTVALSVAKRELDDRGSVLAAAWAADAA